MTVYILLCHVIRFLLPRRVLRMLCADEFQSVFLKGRAIFNIPGPDLFGKLLMLYILITFCENEMAFLCNGNALYEYCIIMTR